MEKWVIEVSEAQLERLNMEQRDLGTLLKGREDKHFLVFRDSFVALKVATQLGVKRSPGRSLPASSAAPYAPLAHFDNGDVLVKEM